MRQFAEVSHSVDEISPTYAMSFTVLVLQCHKPMKHLLHLFIIGVITTSFLYQSKADEEPTRLEVQTEVVEQVLETFQVNEESNLKTLIQLKNGSTFEIEKVPDKEAMKQALGLILPEKIKQQILNNGGVIEDINPLQGYENLSEESQKKFNILRLQFLTNAARILTATKFVFGAGTLVGDAFSFVKVKTLSMIGKKIESPDRPKRTFSQRSQNAVQSILQGIDYKLWSQAPLVIEANEYGLSVSLGIIAESGLLRRGGGGADELGFSLSFNKQKKAFVFEIFHNSEKFDNTKAAFSVIGVVGKASLALAKRSGVESIHGYSFYPPAIPAYSSTSSDYFAAGFSSSLGLPPPPLTDLMTFTNTFERNSLLRITVSPLVKGFVRIQMGSLRGSMRLVAMRFVDVYTAISDKVMGSGRRSCSMIFN